MIVKFDHISFTCFLGDEEAAMKEFAGYEQAFCENNVVNLDIKKDFLELDSHMHDLYMLTKEGGYPIEITSYNQCTEGKNRLHVSGGEFVIKSKDVKETEDFYANLGFVMEQQVMRMKPFLDKDAVTIRIEQDGDLSDKTYLDQKGWGILAFVTDNAERQKRQLDKAGVYTTSVQELPVNGKKLKIFFAESKVGDLVELIGIR